MARPNILFIQVDQLAATSLGCYANGFCHAPNLDRLANEGVVFETAYCNFPLCSPSRASMATGMLASKVGAYDNAAELPASIPTYAHYLGAAGYQTALSGKMHFIGPEQHHGFEKRLTPDLYPADFSWVPNWENEGKRDTNDARSVTISGVCESSVQTDFDDLVTTRAIDHLRSIGASDDRRPFFLQVSYTHPHEPYLCRQKYWDLYEGVDIPLPETPALSPEEHDAHSRRILSDFGMLDIQFDEGDIRRSRRAHFGAISYLDDMIGQVLDALDEAGLSENTAIIFTSDHGEMLGERGIWFKKHFFEAALRVPLIMKIPGETAKRSSTPVSLVDLLPTFMGLAEWPGWLSQVDNLDGRDLVAHLEIKEHDRPIFAEYLAESTTAPIFMIRRGRFKFIASAHDPTLMFDLLDDPHERINLAKDPAHKDLVQQFQNEVDAKWDAAALTQDIKLSQRRRRLVMDSYAGAKPRWNHGEDSESDVPWYRGEGSYNDWAFNYVPASSKS